MRMFHWKDWTTQYWKPVMVIHTENPTPSHLILPPFAHAILNFLFLTFRSQFEVWVGACLDITLGRSQLTNKEVATWYEGNRRKKRRWCVRQQRKHIAGKKVQACCAWLQFELRPNLRLSYLTLQKTKCSAKPFGIFLWPYWAEILRYIIMFVSYSESPILLLKPYRFQWGLDKQALKFRIAGRRCQPRPRKASMNSFKYHFSFLVFNASFSMKVNGDVSNPIGYIVRWSCTQRVMTGHLWLSGGARDPRQNT